MTNTNTNTNNGLRPPRPPRPPHQFRPRQPKFRVSHGHEEGVPCNTYCRKLPTLSRPQSLLFRYLLALTLALVGILLVLALVASRADALTQADIDYHAHKILTYQQAEREQAWLQAQQQLATAQRHQEEHQVAQLATAQRQQADALAEKQSQITSTPISKVASSSTITTTGKWDRLANCEAGGNWAINTGNGYYGGLQFSTSSWRAVGGTGLPHQHSRETQIQMGERLLAAQGWGAWPSCSRKLGYR